MDKFLTLNFQTLVLTPNELIQYHITTKKFHKSKNLKFLVFINIIFIILNLFLTNFLYALNFWFQVFKLKVVCKKLPLIFPGITFTPYQIWAFLFYLCKKKMWYFLKVYTILLSNFFNTLWMNSNKNQVYTNVTNQELSFWFFFKYIYIWATLHLYIFSNFY